MLKGKRVKFYDGEQRKFLDRVVLNLNCVSVRGILQFGVNIKYSTLKNYYIERRLLPSELFEDLCHIAKIEPRKLKVKIIDGNWGQVKGGRVKSQIQEWKFVK